MKSADIMEREALFVELFGHHLDLTAGACNCCTYRSRQTQAMHEAFTVGYTEAIRKFAPQVWNEPVPG